MAAAVNTYGTAAVDAFVKVSSSLTVSEMTHELLHRDPSRAKGLSGKSKDWFLEELGVDSIWSTGTKHASAIKKGPAAITSHVKKKKVDPAIERVRAATKKTAAVKEIAKSKTIKVNGNEEKNCEEFYREIMGTV